MIAQTPWIERQFHLDFPISMFPVIYSRLEGSIFRLQAILVNADEESCSYNANGWSAKEHLGHLYDLEELWWKRLEDFRSGKKILTAADMSNAKTKEADHNSKTLEQLLQLFTAERKKILAAVYSFDEYMLSITSLHPRLQQPMRLIDSLYFVAEHDDHHMAYITSPPQSPKGEESKHTSLFI